MKTSFKINYLLVNGPWPSRRKRSNPSRAVIFTFPFSSPQKNFFNARCPLYIFQLTSMIHHKFKQLQRIWFPMYYKSWHFEIRHYFLKWIQWNLNTIAIWYPSLSIKNIWIYFILFIYLFMAALGLCCCAQAFSSCGKRRLLFVAVRGLLIVVASLVAEHRL